MDPNANLDEQRRIRASILAGLDHDAWKNAMERLWELADALDGWLSHGGFLPKAWER